MDSVWAVGMVAFLLGAAYTVAWYWLKAFAVEWWKVWNEERRDNAKLAERRR